MNESAPARDETARPTPGKQLRRASRIVAAVSLATLSIVVTAPATLAFGTPAPCSARSEYQAFKTWGDPSTYFRVLNGGFELGGASWQLGGGAAAVIGNEPWKVGGSADAKSLKIPFGGSAESQTFCVTLGEDSIRLFVKNAHVPGSILHVQAIVKAGTQTAETAFDVNGDAAPSGWAPTMKFYVPKLVNGTATQTLTLKFTTRGTAATWYIDDVFVDPYRGY